jgi:hypothetical protein
MVVNEDRRLISRDARGMQALTQYRAHARDLYIKGTFTWIVLSKISCNSPHSRLPQFMLRTAALWTSFQMVQKTVAVIGAGRPFVWHAIRTSRLKSYWLCSIGPCGLSMLKTLREDGFKVTCYERRKQVGGLWAYTEDTAMTSALPSTLTSRT